MVFLQSLVPIPYVVFLAVFITTGSLHSNEPNIAPTAVSKQDVAVERDLGTIARKLKKIRDIAQHHEQVLRNLRVKGRFDPTGESFTLVIHGGMCRYDLELAHNEGQPSTTTYWLDDGETSFSFSGDLLVLDPSVVAAGNFKDHIASHFWQFQMPMFDGKRMHVSEFCDNLRNLIEENSYGAGSSVKLTLRETPDATEIELIKISNDATSTAVQRRVVVSLDPSQNYVMTRYADWDPDNRAGPESSLFEEDIRSQYREIAPGVFFLSEGTWMQKSSGSKLDQLEESREAKAMLVVDSVEFGDFELDSSYFDIHQWPPIRKGISVHDNRVQPSEQFVYAKGPFDESVLERALQGVRSPYRDQRSSQIWLLIGINAGVFVLFLVIITVRRWKSPSSE